MKNSFVNDEHNNGTNKMKYKDNIFMFLLFDIVGYSEEKLNII